MLLQGTPEENLKQIWRDINRLYDEYKTVNKYWSIRMTMFHTKSQPKMKGKAAEIKDLLPILIEIWRKYYNPESEILRKTLTVLEGYMDKMLQDHPSEYALPSAAADDLIGTCCITLSTWYDAFKHFKDADMPVPLFGLTGKGHLLMHCCLLSR